MAEYFPHFSCALDVGTPQNAARALDLYNTLSTEGASEEPPPEGYLLSIEPEHEGTKLWMRDDITGEPERLIQSVKRCAVGCDSGDYIFTPFGHLADGIPMTPICRQTPAMRRFSCALSRAGKLNDPAMRSPMAPVSILHSALPSGRALFYASFREREGSGDGMSPGGSRESACRALPFPLSRGYPHDHPVARGRRARCSCAQHSFRRSRFARPSRTWRPYRYIAASRCDGGRVRRL